MGFEHFNLVDGDSIEVHNLNRQAFDVAQVGVLKAPALATQIKRINPHAIVDVWHSSLTRENVDVLVSESDVVIDTIDFLDMSALFALHDAAFEKGKPAFSGFSVGWGAAGMYFENRHFAHQIAGSSRQNAFRSVFSHRQDKNIDPMSYVQRFKKLFELMEPYLNSTVVKVMNDTFQSMIDGRPCPAPQVAVGAQAVAALMVTMVVKHLAGEALPEAPNLLLFDLWRMTESPIVNIGRL